MKQTLTISLYVLAGTLGLIAVLKFAKGKIKPSMQSGKSKYLSDAMIIKSATAQSHGLPNTPNAAQMKNIQAWGKNVFDRVYEYFYNRGAVVFPTSVFRSEEVNDFDGEIFEFVGGSKSSAHMANGVQAAGDLQINNGSTLDLFNYIKHNLDFDQLINEYPVNGKPKWVHVSYRTDGGNRKQVMESYLQNGETKYKTLSNG